MMSPRPSQATQGPRRSVAAGNAPKATAGLALKQYTAGYRRFAESARAPPTTRWRPGGWYMASAEFTGGSS